MEYSLNHHQADKPEQPEADELKADVSAAECSAVAPPQLSLMEDREHLQVYLRIRPFTSAESSRGESQDCVSMEPPDSVLLRPPCLSLSSRLSADKSLPQMGQRFHFSQVFGPDTSQTQLFEGTVKDLVKDVLEGGNSLVFTYGVTNAGKTFTFLGPDANAGILPRSLDVIFSSIEGRVFTGTSIKPHRCREFSRLSREQQLEEELFKRSLFRQMKESDRINVHTLNPVHNTLLEGPSPVLNPAAAAQDIISLEVELHTKFSVWVSFCEIYNENIHDLLEAVPGVAPRRAALRLSQDVKGNAFVKDLRWVQVSSSNEAFKVMKLGKRNQSFSSTRLNQLSSRSHSIFSIRVLKIENTGTPRVHTVSELCLCDLAGSERCAKTQNKGERLKEAGNINTSLLILGKCINALRHNQQARLLQHVPFRESKLTHYLQSFFSGRGRACMIVNINPCASMYDETLNVLKFSAVAQKVVVLSVKSLPSKPQNSNCDSSLVVSSADRKPLHSGRRSSLIGWESSLEDVQEDVDHENKEEDSMMEDTMDQNMMEDTMDQNMMEDTMDQNMMEDTIDQSRNKDQDKILISRQTHRRQVALLRQLQVQLKQERAELLLTEARVREEISREFSQLFSEMQSDYNERLVREREILEERAERRLEIFKNLIDKMTAHDSQDKALEPHPSDMVDIQRAAEAACRSLGSGQSSAVEELQRKVMELHKRRGEELHKHRGETTKEEDEAAQSGQRVDDLQGAALRHSPGCQEGSAERDELQEALSALQKEKKARLDILSALEYQTLGKEEALASLEEERKAREDAVAAVSELRQGRDELLRTHKQEVMTALAEAKRNSEEALAEQTSLREELRSLLEVEKKKTSELEEERGSRQQLVEALRQEVKDLSSRLEAAEQQVRSETQRAEQARGQIHQHSQQIQEKDSEIHSLKLEAKELKEQLQTSSSLGEQLRDQVSELRTDLSHEKEKHQGELQRQLDETHTHHQQQQRAEELRRELQEQEVMSQQRLEELRSKLESQEHSSREEVERLRAKLEEHARTSDERVEQLAAELQGERVTSQNLQKELEHKVSERETLDLVAEQLKVNVGQQEETIRLLTAQLAELQGSSSSTEELKRLNSELQAEVTALRGQLSNQEEEEKQGHASETREGDRRQEAEETTSAELHRKLQEKESQVAALQKSLQGALERREEEDLQAVQEARRKEAERRRELLAVAHEAIAQKDEELEKRRDDIIRLKDDMKQDSEKVKSLSLQLQRTEDEASDLRDKLADYKKQVQQVQKEISVMREEEKAVKQKLSDSEKTRKQLQSEVASRDRTIQQLRLEHSSDTKSNQTLELYQKSCKELEAKERVMEDMRVALTEQEETQAEMEEVLEEKLHLIQELSDEVEKLKGILSQQNVGADAPCKTIAPSHDLDLSQAKQEAAQARDELKMCADKHQAERKRWLEDKLSLIGQAKEAEDKRNQEMRKFAEERERFTRQQNHMEALSSQLAEKDQSMEKWRKERDALVSALEVQLHKLLSSQAEKDKLIQELRCSTQPPPEGGVGVAELGAELREKEAEIQRLKQEVKASSVAQTVGSESPDTLTGKTQSETINRKSEGRRDARASVSSQGSAGYPHVLDSSEISTENGRTSRFPRPELEISFSPLQPNRMALRRQGEQSAVTVKITRSARKRKSGDMEKEEVEAENRRNTRSKVAPKLTPHQEEHSSPVSCQDSGSSVRSRKEGTLQKIGDFLQSSPTLLGTKAKKMMSLVSGRLDVDSPASSSSSSSSSLSLRSKRSKKKLYRPEISSPMDMPSHPIISREAEERESDHQIIRRRLRSRIMK